MGGGNVDYNIDHNPAYSVLTIELEVGDRVTAEPGAMVAHSGVSMTTGGANQGKGGLMRGLTRMLASESFFTNQFAALGDRGWVALAPSAPGDISHVQLQPGGDAVYLQGGAYLASAPGVDIDTRFQGFRGLVSGEGLFFLKAIATAGAGDLWFAGYGAIHPITVRVGDTVTVDTGHLVAFTDGVRYSIDKSGGIKSLIAGGEGLVTILEGDGTAWIQTRSLSQMVRALTPFLPSDK